MGLPAEWVLLAVDGVVFSILYKLYKSSTAATEKIKSCPDFEIGPDLMAALEKAPERTLPYACIEGVVDATGKTLKSNYGNEEGVIKKLLLQEHRTKRTQGHWSDWTKVIRDNTETVPFILRDAEIPAAAGSVFITEPLQASTLQEELTPTYDVFEPNKSSLMERGLDRIFGDVSKGIQESEHMLKLGTNIVGIGEIILQGEKAVMRAPKAGGDYVLTLFSKAEIIKRFESKSLWYKVALGFLGVTGVVIFSYAIRKLYKTWQDNIQREQETQRILEARRQNRDGNEAGDGNVQECVICLTNPREVIVLNCGHICMCADCAGVLPSPRKCPICRADIARIIPTFNA